MVTAPTLLGEHLQPFMDLSFPDNDGMFQQDNASSHRAADVQDWFEDRSGELQRMEWPAHPPDMNPIEHLWDVVEKRRVIDGRTALSFVRRGDDRVDAHVSVAPSVPTLLGLKSLQPGCHLNLGEWIASVPHGMLVRVDSCTHVIDKSVVRSERGIAAGGDYSGGLAPIHNTEMKQQPTPPAHASKMASLTNNAVTNQRLRLTQAAYSSSAHAFNTDLSQSNTAVNVTLWLTRRPATKLSPTPSSQSDARPVPIATSSQSEIDYVKELRRHFVSLCLVSLDRRMNKVMMRMAMLILHKAEEYTTGIQVDLKQGFQKCSFDREQPIREVAVALLPPALQYARSFRLCDDEGWSIGEEADIAINRPDDSLVSPGEACRASSSPALGHFSHLNQMSSFVSPTSCRTHLFVITAARGKLIAGGEGRMLSYPRYRLYYLISTSRLNGAACYDIRGVAGPCMSRGRAEAATARDSTYLLRYTDDVTSILPTTPAHASNMAVLASATCYKQHSHLGEPGSNPGGVVPVFSHVGMVAHDAAGRWVSRFPRPCIPAMLHTHLTSTSSALKTSMLRVVHILFAGRLGGIPPAKLESLFRYYPSQPVLAEKQSNVRTRRLAVRSQRDPSTSSLVYGLDGEDLCRQRYKPRRVAILVTVRPEFSACAVPGLQGGHKQAKPAALVKLPLVRGVGRSGAPGRP
ncbi:hypothetical protein PR048_022633 [Dryococelus australis]|uniref:Tc1-like transposase DDE domain-containing protein n=1 Tax=Dryococelus australis TaxID=614101 RepID=A0ABQ9H1T8_9NEOP|nr:hypothetical protein PR048_022633 [Dryococelus australis]